MSIRIKFSDYQRLAQNQPTVIIYNDLEGIEPGQEVDVNFRGSIIGVRIVDLWRHSQMSMWCLKLIPTFHFSGKLSDC
ncbi:hypothetical protein ACL6C3_27795 [Capilliphycus salinus ALCB114379]|uniref:hypothetical protein n=1 Tax=Capilliphycus salinus TaxID=2768948 RepID=UPI0039A4C794